MANEEWKTRNERLMYAFFQNAVHKSIALQYSPALNTHCPSLKTLKGGVFLCA
jgi:hypothetical protein